MVSSRKTILAAIALLFVSQFFRYNDIGHTTITMDLGKNLTYGGLPYGGETGWELHSWWFYIPLMAVFAYLFYTSPRSVIVYWLCLALFVFAGMGSGFGGILGGISILIYGYAVYKKVKENSKKKLTIVSKEVA